MVRFTAKNLRCQSSVLCSVFFGLGWVEGGDDTKESGSFPSVPSSARTYQDLFKPAPTCRHQYQYFHQHPLQRQQWQTCVCRRPAASCRPLPASRGASTLPPARTEAAVKERSATARGALTSVSPTQGAGPAGLSPPPLPGAGAQPHPSKPQPGKPPRTRALFLPENWFAVFAFAAQ